MSFTLPIPNNAFLNALAAYGNPGGPVIYKNQLQYKDYSWRAAQEHDNARITGFPDSVLLSRHEGYEVLPFLNRFCEATTYKGTNARFGLAEALKAERMIRTALPPNERSHAHVNQWLVANWSRY